MKQICVLDTDSIVIGMSVELGHIRLIDWMSRLFDIYIPNFIVRNELKSASMDYDIDIQEIRRKLCNIKVKVIADEYFDACIKLITKWLAKSRLDIDDGEKYCLGLSLCLSRNLRDFVFLVTDDFRARDTALDKFMDKQKIGVILSSPDVILYTFARNRHVTGSHTLSSFQQFFGKMEAKKILGKKQRYMESYEQICRKFGLDYRVCQQQCYSMGQIIGMASY